MSDDPYTPFYPGDQWVDWVGMNQYHMGQVSHLLNAQIDWKLVQSGFRKHWKLLGTPNFASGLGNIVVAGFKFAVCADQSW